MLELFGLFKNLKDKRIIIFGTGKASEIISSYMPFDIVFYLDNDEKKWNKHLNEKVIKHPESIRDEEPGKFAVIIASMFFNEISNQLLDMGLVENKDFWNGTYFFCDAIDYEISKFKQVKQDERLYNSNVKVDKTVEIVQCNWAKNNELVNYIEENVINEETMTEIIDKSIFGADSIRDSIWGLKGFSYGYVIENIRMLHKESLCMLDVGGGYSRLGALLSKKHNGECWVVDDFGVESGEESVWTRNIDREKLREVNRNIKYVYERLGEIEKSSLPKNYFDVIYSVSALEHIPMSCIASVFDHMAALLKPDGVMIYTVDLDQNSSYMWKQFLLDYFSESSSSIEKIGYIEGMNDPDIVNDILVEPLNIMHKYYFRNSKDIEKKYKRYGTLCIIVKPKIKSSI